MQGRAFCMQNVLACVAANPLGKGSEIAPRVMDLYWWLVHKAPIEGSRMISVALIAAGIRWERRQRGPERALLSVKSLPRWPGAGSVFCFPPVGAGA